MEQLRHGSWQARKRIRRIAHLASGAGLLLALIVVAAARPATAAGWLDFGFVTGSLGVLAVGALAPRLLVPALWRLVHWHDRAESR